MFFTKSLFALRPECALLPINASVVVVAIEELDLLKSLLTGVVAGQVRVHAKEQVERRCA